jgi:RimJ/RimL family protein N-acetyltransferase
MGAEQSSDPGAQMVRMTRRLHLEPIAHRHAGDLYRLYQDPVVAYWYGGSWSRDEAETYADQCHEAWRRDGIHKWMAYDRKDGGLVGRGGLSRLPVVLPRTEQIALLMAGTNWHHDRLEVGWAVLSERQRHGYATEIGSEALVFAREVLGASAVVAFTEVINLASRAVMERIGMDPVGKLRGTGLVEGAEGVREDAPFAVYAVGGAPLRPGGAPTVGIADNS